MKGIGKRISTRMKIVAATATVIFTLATVFTSTIAWFSTKTSVDVSGGSFQVKAMGGIQYNLYYLDHFVIDQQTNKDGNFNTVVNCHAGYEVPTANPVFLPINFDENGYVIDNNQQVVTDDLNPTNIRHLWPAHRLTYAIVIESGTIANFTLDSWDEETDNNVKTKDGNDEDVLISLSWAINLYGKAYNVTKTNTVTDDIAAGFNTYKNASINDAFLYSQAYTAPASEPTLPISVTSGVTGQGGENTRQILYFSIEFDDSDSTYYEYDSATSYYTKSASGNSNCYESLILKDLVFKLE